MARWRQQREPAPYYEGCKAPFVYVADSVRRLVKSKVARERERERERMREIVRERVNICINMFVYRKFLKNERDA